MSKTTHKTCAICGTSFVGGFRAIYCPECRAVVKRQQAVAAQRRRRAGLSSALPRERNKKVCIVCGAAFECPPSSKTVTCSSDCRSVRARSSLAARRAADPLALTGTPEAAKKRYLNQETLEAARRAAQKASEAAMLLPEGQRGPQHRTAKNWILIDPDGFRIEVANLLDWAREYYDFFEPDADDIDAAACRIASGFRAIACSMRGVPSRKRPVRSYKGWSLYALPTDKED